MIKQDEIERVLQSELPSIIREFAGYLADRFEKEGALRGDAVRDSLADYAYDGGLVHELPLHWLFTADIGPAIREAEEEMDAEGHPDEDGEWWCDDPLRLRIKAKILAEWFAESAADLGYPEKVQDEAERFCLWSLTGALAEIT